MENRELQMRFYMKHKLIMLENLLRGPGFATPAISEIVQTQLDSKMES